MQARRQLLAEKLMDVANIAVAAMIFGQLISGQPFHIGLGIAGFALWSLIYFAAYFYLLKERE
ncbi:MAG: hypothetical protein A3H28_00875 [Acidobacteria bacterium RIFCSPLOWO2_02_FULL_61_28]|nr:MAG: hypothetical protein A3H28_00875 [Acidobacteria bacterium RIFCSPLOWO2_02_FULL_61_28]